MKKPFYSPFLVALLLVISSFWLPAAAAESGLCSSTPEACLRTMAEADSSTNYRGLLRYHRHNEAAVRFRVVYGIFEGQAFERLTYLDSTYREMIRHGSRLVFAAQSDDKFLQTLAATRPSEAFHHSFAKMFNTIPKQYGLAFGPKSELAGRPVSNIKVLAKDPHRYGYQLWVDTETALLLRFEVVNASQTVLESFSFDKIEIGLVAVQPEDLTLQTRPNQAKLEIKLDQEADQKDIDMPDQISSNWRVAWLPEDFKVVSYGRQQPFRKNVRSFHSFAYSDGLAAFSLYIESLPDSIVKPFVQHVGGTSTVISQTEDSANLPYMIMVIGEIPAATAQRIAQSVFYQDQSNLRPAKLGNY